MMKKTRVEQPDMFIPHNNTQEKKKTGLLWWLLSDPVGF